MRKTISPWLLQINNSRETNALTKDRETDIVIVGAGIAGITSAYFILKNTKTRVMMVESSKVAHGATGHNAGQLVSYFEKQMAGLVKDYGLRLAAEGQKAIDSAWGLLENIYKNTKINAPFADFLGRAGLQSNEEILLHLENSYLTKKAGLKIEKMYISNNYKKINSIPPKFKDFFVLVPHKEILEKLETHNEDFIACIVAKKGVLNSALFCEEILDFIFKKYPDRFTLFENSHVSEVVLSKDNVKVNIRNHKITAQKVILCTNGFEKFKITNLAGENINTQFHHLVNGSVGYMTGYYYEDPKHPIAISYLPKSKNSANNPVDKGPYFYLTRRSFKAEGKNYTLVCVGGPETLMKNTNFYTTNYEYPSKAHEIMHQFLKDTYIHAPKEKIKYKFKWHGLMGYTPNGVRCIGPEPINPRLLYNLGCNGVGILPSIYGSKKICEFLKGKKLKKSIFDPQDSRHHFKS